MATKKTGRPPKVIEPIPDTFEKVIEALVSPAPEKQETKK